MALADLDAFTAARANPLEGASTVLTIPTLTASAGLRYDLWTTSVPAPSAPTTAVAPGRTTAGALGQQDGASGTLGIIGAEFSAMGPGSYFICDRLSHQGGLSGTVTTAQTTNLSTAALTRYTSGEGVMLCVTIYTQIGTTATTVSASYTNQAGTSGKTTPTTGIGGTGYREAGRMILLPLATGDTGVRSVQSVTLTATTGTAGAFGVTLFKPLAAVVVGVDGGTTCDFITGGMGGGLPEIVDDACLYAMFMPASYTVLGTANAMGTGAIFTTEW